MAAAKRLFGDENPYGVLAYGIDRKVTRGRMLKKAALNVYVVHKHNEPEKHVPEVVVRGRGLRIRPDVIGVGSAPCVHQASNQPPMLGLYPGAAIRADARVTQYGGVSCVLGDGNSPTHLITAGHLFPARTSNVEVVGARCNESPTVIGKLEVNLLDAPFSDMDHPIDVALVRLNASGVLMAQQSLDGPRMQNFIASDAVGDIDVSAFLPTAHDCSRTTQTLDGPLDAHMRSPARGVYAVHQVVGTRAVITNPGDSGTILYNGTVDSAAAVGICVGQFGAMSIFEPFGRALSTLQEGTGLDLSLM